MTAADHLSVQYRTVPDAYSTSHYVYLPGEDAYVGVVYVSLPSPDDPSELAYGRIRGQA
jgi:hypothetical protein